MGFSVLQTEAVLPPEDALVFAFSKIEALTNFDARQRANGVAGWIAWDLAHEDAMAVMIGLAERNIGAAIVEDHEVPELSEAYRTRSVTATPAGFSVPDALNRPIEMTWDQVAVVAGGVIQRRPRPSGAGLTGAGLGTLAGAAGAVAFSTAYQIPMTRQPVSGPKPIGKAKANNHFELILTSGQRFTLQDARAIVKDLPGSDVEDPGVALATVFAHAAPWALVNTGIQQAVESGSLRAYRSPSVLERETRWLQWLLGSLSG